ITYDLSITAYSFFVFMMRPLPSSTLFPYTTLFRSRPVHQLLPLSSVSRALPIFRLLLSTHPPHRHRFRRRFPAVSRTESVRPSRSEEHTSELQSRENLVCRLLLEKKKLACFILFSY